jgi:hypothetical protein
MYISPGEAQRLRLRLYGGQSGLQRRARQEGDRQTARIAPVYMLVYVGGGFIGKTTHDVLTYGGTMFSFIREKTFDVSTNRRFPRRWSTAWHGIPNAFSARSH